MVSNVRWQIRVSVVVPGATASKRRTCVPPEPGSGVELAGLYYGSPSCLSTDVSRSDASHVKPVDGFDANSTMILLPTLIVAGWPLLASVRFDSFGLHPARSPRMSDKVRICKIFFTVHPLLTDFVYILRGRRTDTGKMR